jgi:hypothetical protein
MNARYTYYNIGGGKSIIFSEVQFIQSTEGKISILSISMYVCMYIIFFTIGSRNQLLGCQCRDRSRTFSP